MIMRKSLIALLVITLLLPAAAFAAAPTSFNEAVTLGNKDIKARYGYWDN